MISFKHPGLTDQVGRPAEVEIRAPETHMGGWVMAVSYPVDAADADRRWATVVMDRGALKELLKALVGAL